MPTKERKRDIQCVSKVGIHPTFERSTRSDGFYEPVLARLSFQKKASLPAKTGRFWYIFLKQEIYVSKVCIHPKISNLLCNIVVDGEWNAQVENRDTSCRLLVQNACPIFSRSFAAYLRFLSTSATTTTAVYVFSHPCIFLLLVYIFVTFVLLAAGVCFLVQWFIPS